MRVQRLIKETCKIVSEDVGEVKAAQIARSAQKLYAQKTRPIPKNSDLIHISAFILELQCMKP